MEREKVGKKGNSQAKKKKKKKKGVKKFLILNYGIYLRFM